MMQNAISIVIPRFLALLIVCLYLAIKFWRHRHLFVPWVLITLGTIGLWLGGTFIQIPFFGLEINSLIVVAIIIQLININPQKINQAVNGSIKLIVLATILGVLFGGIFAWLTLGNRTIAQGEINYLMTVFLVLQIAIGEEIFFRGFIQGYLKNLGLGFWEVAFLQSLPFVVSHTNFFDPQNFVLAGPILLTIFSITSGWLTWKSNNILVAIVFHFITNFASLMLINYVLNPTPLQNSILS